MQLERGQKDRKTECINYFKLCWKKLKREKNHMLKKFIEFRHQFLKHVSNLNSQRKEKK